MARRPHTDPIRARHEVVFRSFAGGSLGCGFLRKAGPGGGYVNRLDRDYIGVLVLRGRGEAFDDRGRRYPVGPGDYIQHPPNQAHGVVPGDPDWSEFYMRFPAQLYETLRTLGVADRQTVLHPGLAPPLLERCDGLLEAVRQTPHRELPLVVVRMHELLVTGQRLALRPGPDSEPSLIDRACEALGRDIGRSLDMADLADRLGVSYERFRKVFRQRVGLAPGEYRIRRRIDHARRLLAQERLTVKEAAYRLGYPDPFSFSRQFKRYTGVSPSRFAASI